MTDLYRVYVNNGHDGGEDIDDLSKLESLAYYHLVKRESDKVEFKIMALKIGGKRVDGIGHTEF